jgi:hypothetical protein
VVSPTRRQRFRRRKAPTAALVQYRAERVVAKLDGGNIDHESGLQRIVGKRNPSDNPSFRFNKLSTDPKSLFLLERVKGIEPSS